MLQLFLPYAVLGPPSVLWQRSILGKSKIRKIRSDCGMRRSADWRQRYIIYMIFLFVIQFIRVEHCFFSMPGERFQIHFLRRLRVERVVV
jgi:hypothetical protein